MRLPGEGGGHIADGPRRVADQGRHPGIADPRRALGPGHLKPAADLRLPVRAPPRQIGGEGQRRGRPVRPVHQLDGGMGQGHMGIEGDQPGIVPMGDPAEIDVGHDRAVQLQLPRHQAQQVHHRHHAADDHRELHQARPVQLHRRQGHVGGAEVHGPRLDLLQAAAGADGHVAHRVPALGGIERGPLAIEGLRPAGPHAGDVRGPCCRPEDEQGRSDADCRLDHGLFPR